MTRRKLFTLSSGEVSLSVGQIVHVKKRRPINGRYEIIGFEGEERVLLKPLFKTDYEWLNTYAENVSPL